MYCSDVPVIYLVAYLDDVIGRCVCDQCHSLQHCGMGIEVFLKAGSKDEGLNYSSGRDVKGCKGYLSCNI